MAGLIHHRRAGGELSPPMTNLQNWYTFRDPEDVTLVSVDKISFVTDRQAHTNLQQTSASLRPTHLVSGISGQHTCSLDGIDDKLGVVSNWAGLNVPYTVAGVFKFNSIDVSGAGVFQDTTSGPEIGHNGSNFHMTSDNGASIIVGSAVDTVPHTFVARFNGASSEFRLDGVSDATGNPSNSDLVGITFGPSFNGTNALLYVGEFLVYSADVTGTPLVDLESYLSTKWP